MHSRGKREYSNAQESINYITGWLLCGIVDLNLKKRLAKFFGMEYCTIWMGNQDLEEGKI